MKIRTSLISALTQTRKNQSAEVMGEHDSVAWEMGEMAVNSYQGQSLLDTALGKDGVGVLSQPDAVPSERTNTNFLVLRHLKKWETMRYKNKALKFCHNINKLAKKKMGG